MSISVKIFTRIKCPKCPAVKSFVPTLKERGIDIIEYNVDTVEGLAEGAFYSVMSTPSILLIDSNANDMCVCDWRGEVPSLQDVLYEIENRS